MNSQHSQGSQEQVLRFMMAEYAALREARRLSYTVSSNSSNLFLAAVSGAIIALGVIGKVDILEDHFFLVSLVILFGLFIVGLCTFARTLEGQIICRIYLRGMNKIRRYFVEEVAPNVEDYMILPVCDDKPAFCSAGSNPRKWIALFINPPGVLATINSIIGSVLITGIILKVSCNLSTPRAIFYCGTVVFRAIFITHHIYQISRLKKAEEKWEKSVRFPSPLPRRSREHEGALSD